MKIKKILEEILKEDILTEYDKDKYLKKFLDAGFPRDEAETINFNSDWGKMPMEAIKKLKELRDRDFINVMGPLLDPEISVFNYEDVEGFNELVLWSEPRDFNNLLDWYNVGWKDANPDAFLAYYFVWGRTFRRDPALLLKWYKAGWGNQGNLDYHQLIDIASRAGILSKKYKDPKEALKKEGLYWKSE